MFSLQRPQRTDLWSLFDWFGRSCDQAAGVLLNPLIVVIYARSIEDDLVRLSYLVSAFGVAWLLGAATGPVLQRATVRVMPWIVGGFTVRTASAALLAYSASDRSSPSDQRYRSALICLAAYAAATGLARSAEARHLRSRPTLEAVWLRPLMGTLGATAIMAVGAWAMWSVLSVVSIPWSGAFGRVWALAAIALGVASLAAIVRGSATPELPAEPSAARPNLSQHSGFRHIIGGLAAISLGAIVMFEALALLTLFADFRRDSAVIRASLAFFAIGWLIGAPLARIALDRLVAPLILQVSIGISAVVLAGAVSLRDIVGADWFPNHIDHRDPVALTIYAVAGSVGVASAMRRMAMAQIARSAEVPAGASGLGFGLLAAMAPIGVALCLDSVSANLIMMSGMAVALVGLILTGAIDSGTQLRRLPGDRGPTQFALSARQ
jgi:hypothetical protein